MSSLSELILVILPTGPVLKLAANAAVIDDAPTTTAFDKSRSLITTPGET